MLTKLVTAQVSHNYKDAYGDTNALVAGEVYELVFKDWANFNEVIALGKLVDVTDVLQADLTIIGANKPRRLNQAAIPASGLSAHQVAPGEMVLCRVGTAEVQTLAPSGAETSDCLATSGSYTLAFGADETDSLAFDADSTAIGVALNALDTISAAGAVTVAGAGLGASAGMAVTFAVTAGDVAALVVDSTALSGPFTVVNVTETTPGSGVMHVVYNDAIEGVDSIALA